MEFIQFVFSETDIAAKEIASEVLPVADEATKEDIAEAAVEKAEDIADKVVSEDATDEEFAEVVSVISQSLYTTTMANIAMSGAAMNLETLFAEEEVNEYYNAVEDAIQEAYADEDLYAEGRFKRFSNKMKKYGTATGGHLKKHAIPYGAGVTGAAAGAVIGDRIAQKRGISRRKGQLIGALVGGTGTGSAALGAKAAWNKWGKKKD